LKLANLEGKAIDSVSFQVRGQAMSLTEGNGAQNGAALLK
jgi:hypothetical protein